MANLGRQKLGAKNLRRPKRMKARQVFNQKISRARYGDRLRQGSPGGETDLSFLKINSPPVVGFVRKPHSPQPTLSQIYPNKMPVPPPAEPSTEAAFLSQLADCQQVVQKIARVYGRTEADRADLRQEILMQAWRAWPGFRGDSKFSTWLYKIGLNTALMARRRERPPTVEILPEKDAMQQPVEPIPTDLERLYAAIDRLELADKSLVLLWLDDLSYAEISEITGLSQSNVGVKLNRIRAKLREFMAIEN